MHSFDPQLKRHCWMTCEKEEENCMGQSGCSESHAHNVFQQKWTCVWPSSANLYNGQWPVLPFTHAW
jgi:hypothetical protein